MGLSTSNDRAWDALLREFRALGGTAENIRLGIGPLGRGVFAVEPAKPVLVRVPDNLLVPSRNIVFPHGTPRVDPGAGIGDRERAWLNRYLEEFSWPGGRADVERLFKSAGALPADLRHRLTAEFRCGTWFQGATDKIVQQHYVRARGIAYRGAIVLPPILELANHGAATGFDHADGLSLGGIFTDEILVEYSDLDALGIFQAWGFAFPSPVALSIPLRGDVHSVPLAVGRDRSAFDPARGVWVPILARENGQQKMSFVLLGHERYPRLAKGIFFKLMREAGYSDAAECFGQIQTANRTHFLGLQEAVRKFDCPIAGALRTMAEYQLRAMTFSQDFP